MTVKGIAVVPLAITVAILLSSLVLDNDWARGLLVACTIYVYIIYESRPGNHLSRSDATQNGWTRTVLREALMVVIVLTGTAVVWLAFLAVGLGWTTAWLAGLAAGLLTLKILNIRQWAHRPR